jgi:hypothetical protein
MCQSDTSQWLRRLWVARSPPPQQTSCSPLPRKNTLRPCAPPPTCHFRSWPGPCFVGRQRRPRWHAWLAGLYKSLPSRCLTARLVSTSCSRRRMSTLHTAPRTHEPVPTRTSQGGGRATHVFARSPDTSCTHGIFLLARKKSGACHRAAFRGDSGCGGQRPWHSPPSPDPCSSPPYLRAPHGILPHPPPRHSAAPILPPAHRP